MPTLVWKAPMQYFSQRDEAAFLSWLQSIPAVTSIRGQGLELHIQLRSKRLSQENLRELIALYTRYEGNLPELADFENDSNRSWFKNKDAYWFDDVFGEAGAV